MRRSLLLTAATLLAATALTACSGQEPAHQATAGEAIVTDYPVAGEEMYLSVPSGKFEFTVSPRLTNLDEYRDPNDPEVTPPEGGGFIGISWGLPLQTGRMQAYFVDEIEPANFTLVAGDQRYPVSTNAKIVRGEGSGNTRLPDRMTSAGPSTYFVPIKGDPKNISLEVEYDGAIQSINLVTGERDTGLATGMYEASAERFAFSPNSCGSIRPSGPYPRLEWDESSCSFEPFTGLVPYTSDLGWAPEGKRWAIISVHGRLAYKFLWNFTGDSWPVDGRSQEYRSIDFADEVTLDDARPMDSAPYDPPEQTLDENDHAITYTWQVAPDAPLRLRVHHTYSSDQPGNRGGRTDPAIPPSVKVEIDKTVTMKF